MAAGILEITIRARSCRPDRSSRPIAISTIQISVTPVKPTVGNGEAALPVKLVPVAGSEMDGQVAAVDLPVIWRYENPRDPWVFWIVVTLTALASIALPLLTLGLANWGTARFDVEGLRGEVIPVAIGPDGPKRLQPLSGAPETVLDSYQMSAVPVPNRRQFTFGPVKFTSKSRISPFKVPSFSVSPVDGSHRVMSSVPPPTSDGKTAAASPGLGFLVVVEVAETDLVDATKREVPATIIVLMRDLQVSSAQLDPLMNSKIDWTTLTERWRDGVDVALSWGRPTDSALIQRKLATSKVRIYASPAYLARRGVPKSLAALATHDCLASGHERGWTFREGPRVVTVPVVRLPVAAVLEAVMKPAVPAVPVDRHVRRGGVTRASRRGAARPAARAAGRLPPARDRSSPACGAGR